MEQASSPSPRQPPYQDQDLDIDTRLEELKTRGLEENTAQSVFNDLEGMKENKAWVRNRWIWELIQNAIDAKANEISVQHDNNQMIFKHNGRPFDDKEIFHLIFHGSTKTEDPDTIGRYGSGFLTTHLLSHEVIISGSIRLDNDVTKSLSFSLKRNPDNAKSIAESMHDSWEKFKSSIGEHEKPDYTTFRYLIEDDDSKEVVNSGIEMLNRCAPYVVIFNEKNLCITVQSESTGRITYKVSERCAAEDRPQPHKVVVAKVVDETETTRAYYVAQAAMCAAGVQGKVQVAIPTEFNGAIRL